MTATFDDIPNELIYELLMKSKGQELIQLCQTSRNISNICNSLSDSFWFRKFLSEYGPPPTRKPPYFNWRQFYLAYTLYNIKYVHINDAYGPRVWIYRGMTYRTLIDYLKPIVRNNLIIIPINQRISAFATRLYLRISDLVTSPKFVYVNEDENRFATDEVSVSLTLDDPIDYDQITLIRDY